jgi:hypothetical protein
VPTPPATAPYNAPIARNEARLLSGPIFSGTIVLSEAVIEMTIGIIIAMTAESVTNIEIRALATMSMNVSLLVLSAAPPMLMKTSASRRARPCFSTA